MHRIPMAPKAYLIILPGISSGSYQAVVITGLIIRYVTDKWYVDKYRLPVICYIFSGKCK